MVPQRQISRPAKEAKQESVRAASEDKFDLRHELETLFKEYSLVPRINAKSFESSYSEVRGSEDNNSPKRDGIENESNVEIYFGTPFSKRRKDNVYGSSMQDKMERGYHVDGSRGEGLGIGCPGNQFRLGRMTGDGQPYFTN